VLSCTVLSFSFLVYYLINFNKEVDMTDTQLTDLIGDIEQQWPCSGDDPARDLEVYKERWKLLQNTINPPIQWPDTQEHIGCPHFCGTRGLPGCSSDGYCDLKEGEECSWDSIAATWDSLHAIDR
jgi:hypothetical protein